MFLPDLSPGPCHPNPCQNGGVCELVPNRGDVFTEYICRCPEGYDGKLCQKSECWMLLRAMAVGMEEQLFLFLDCQSMATIGHANWAFWEMNRIPFLTGGNWEPLGSLQDKGPFTRLTCSAVIPF
uniref:EGF-like domain-containing protein n=1 Tax=Anolis carolinensis TaxID=28377 RepID=A0A803TRU5_ANOCA